VIEAGKIRATGSVADVVRGVQAQRTRIYVRAIASVDALHKALLEEPDVHDVRIHRGGVLVELDGQEDRQALLLKSLVSRGLDPIEFAPTAVDLEDVFLSLTRGQVQ